MSIEGNEELQDNDEKQFNDTNSSLNVTYEDISGKLISIITLLQSSIRKSKLKTQNLRMSCLIMKQKFQQTITKI